MPPWCSIVGATVTVHQFFRNLQWQFEGKVYHQIMGIPMSTNCALLEVDLYFNFVMRQILCLTFTSLNSAAL